MEIIEDNLHPKVLKNRLFINAIDHLIEQKVGEDQKGVSARTGLTEATLSNIRNDKKIVSDKTIRKFLEGFPGIFNPAYFKGENIYMTLTEEMEAKIYAEEQKKKEEQQAPQPEIPDFIQKLFDEAVRMQTHNELLERQCEQLIAELRDSKDKNESFLAELHKSKEFNDTLVAELKISRVQNDNLISELRETKKQNAMLATKLEAAIDGIEGMKNQLAMMVGSYATPQPPAFSPLSVNDDAVMPEGLIRGEHQAFTEEYAQSANIALDSQPRRV